MGQERRKELPQETEEKTDEILDGAYGQSDEKKPARHKKETQHVDDLLCGTTDF